MSISKDQVSSDRRFMGIPVVGRPSAVTPVLTYDEPNQQFIWGAGGGGSSSKYLPTAYRSISSNITRYTILGNEDITSVSVITQAQVELIFDMTVKACTMLVGTNSRSAITTAGWNTNSALEVPSFGWGGFSTGKFTFKGLNYTISDGDDCCAEVQSTVLGNMSIVAWLWEYE